MSVAIPLLPLYAFMAWIWANYFTVSRIYVELARNIRFKITHFYISELKVKAKVQRKNAKITSTIYVVVQSWMGGNNNRELRDAVGIVCQQAVYIMHDHCANSTSCSGWDSLAFKVNSV